MAHGGRMEQFVTTAIEDGDAAANN